MTIQEALTWAQEELARAQYDLSFRSDPGSPAIGLRCRGGEAEESAFSNASAETDSGCPILRSFTAKGGSENADQTIALDARTLLQHALKKNQSWLHAHSNETLDEPILSIYNSFIERRKQHEPIQYITGEQEFYGIPIRVTPAVLIPRPETEHLVEEALLILEKLPAGTRLLDIGTGSGAIVIPIALSSPATRITAVDISQDALQVAQANLAAHNLTHRIRLLQSDLFSEIAGEEFEIILSNPPYVAEADRKLLAEQVRNYEPQQALFAGADGLDIYRKLIPASAAALSTGGYLLLEIGAGQSDAIRNLFEQSNLTNIRFVVDLQQIPRVAIAQKQ
jgi:release factor glutamine methyltransferase